MFQRKQRKNTVLTQKPLRCEILKRFLKKEVQQKRPFVWTLCLFRPFTLVFLQHILMMHVNDSLQQLFALTGSYGDPKTLLIFHFLYVFFTDRPLSSTVFCLYRKTFSFCCYRNVNFIISRGCDFSCSVTLFYKLMAFPCGCFGKEM